MTRAEWDVDLWVKFKRTGPLRDLNERDPEFIDESIAYYIGEEVELDLRYQRGDEVVTRVSDWRGWDQGFLSNLPQSTEYVRAFAVEGVDMWTATYEWVESTYRNTGTVLRDSRTTLEGFALFKAIVGADSSKRAIQAAYDYFKSVCGVCGDIKMEVMW